jgi:hypothetical protein
VRKQLYLAGISSHSTDLSFPLQTLIASQSIPAKAQIGVVECPRARISQPGLKLVRWSVCEQEYHSFDLTYDWASQEQARINHSSAVDEAAGTSAVSIIFFNHSSPTGACFTLRDGRKPKRNGWSLNLRQFIQY